MSIGRLIPKPPKPPKFKAEDVVCGVFLILSYEGRPYRYERKEHRYMVRCLKCGDERLEFQPWFTSKRAHKCPACGAHE